ncbi:hypothetical protein [Adhaeribacter pallidiroseus]|uniref:hypothetical protein n=1 Tax=Adhaeribacter pallidiroseus TaxID=2072847 RepID=UPI0011C05091|nr:hypothetical protein [Adhaeribacter pallidiroseus]
MIFSFTQLYLFLIGTFGGDFVEPFGIMILNPPTIGTYFPRLTGGLYDPNIGGYFLTFLFVLNRQFKVNIKYNKYMALLILLTLSRSAIMAFILVLVIDKAINFILNKPRISINTKISKKFF